MPPIASARPISSSQVVAGRAKRRKRGRIGERVHVRRADLCPSDQPLRHGVGDRRGVAAACSALFGPDLLEPNRNALDPLAGPALASPSPRYSVQTLMIPPALIT